MFRGRPWRGVGLAIAALVLAGASAAHSAWGQSAAGNARAGERVTLSGTYRDHQFLTGGKLRINANVEDDLFVAGGDVELQDASAETLIAVGGDVRMSRITVNDAILAGGNVSVSGGILDDLVAAAGMLRVLGDADILDDARLAAGTIEITGRIGGDLHATGGRIMLAGEVMGNAYVDGRNVVLTPTARIGGDLRYFGDEPPEVAKGAQVGGVIAPVERDLFVLDDLGASGPGLGTFIAWLIAVVGLIVAGAAFRILFPTLLADSVARMTKRKAFSLAVGVALFVAIPVFAVLLAVTVIGFPVGLIVLTLYPVFVVLAALVAGSGIGLGMAHRLYRRARAAHLRSDGADLGWIAIGIFLLALVALVPYAGKPIALLFVVGGLGALATEIWARLQTGRSRS